MPAASASYASNTSVYYFCATCILCLYRICIMPVLSVYCTCITYINSINAQHLAAQNDKEDSHIYTKMARKTAKNKPKRVYKNFSFFFPFHYTTLWLVHQETLQGSAYVAIKKRSYVRTYFWKRMYHNLWTNAEWLRNALFVPYTYQLMVDLKDNQFNQCINPFRRNICQQIIIQQHFKIMDFNGSLPLKELLPIVDRS